MNPEILALGAIRYVVFLFSTTCHEAAHSLAAKLGGDETASRGGQVSLNPLPHIRREPFGMVIIPLLALFLGGAMLGWASAPYDPLWQRRYPRRAAWMSLAGPAANFSLVLVAAFLIRAGIAFGAFHPPNFINFYSIVEAVHPGYVEGLAKLISILFSLNLMLGMFNLVPIPPLDGFSVLGLFTTESMARRLEDLRDTIGAFSILGLMLGWKMFEYLYSPVFHWGLTLLYPGLY